MKRTMKDVHGEDCAVAATAELIAMKWTPLIVHDLSEGPRTLSERLDMLERQGVALRRSYPESPPRVEYELTEKGRALLPIIREMRRFGRSWMIDEHHEHSPVAAR
jgi:DNA-binding HxlR family transcriptional regulator